MLFTPPHPFYALLFRVRKQLRSSPREKKVPYLIISSHNEKHIVAALLYGRCRQCWVPFGKQGSALLRGEFWLKDGTWWWGTSGTFEPPCLAYAKTNHVNFDRSRWQSAWVCVCVCEINASSKPHFLFSFIFFQPDHLSVDCSIIIMKVMHSCTEQHALLYPWLLVVFAHSASHKNRPTLSTRCAF